MEPKHSKTMVYFDGECSLCRSEISVYKRDDRDQALCFVDISEPSAVPPEGISHECAMKRFHVRAGDGRILSGAAAFVEVWTCLPRWRWAARVASLPGALIALERGYKLFLPVRPLISRFLGRVLRLYADISRPKRP